MCAVQKHPDSEHFKNSYFVFENGIKFRAIFCLRALNLANFLKSRNSILAKISKNKVTGPDRNKKSNTYGEHTRRQPFSFRSFLKKVLIFIDSNIRNSKLATEEYRA